MRLGSSEEHYRLLFDENPQPMWLFEAETLKFLEINQAAIEKYGYTREEFLGMTIADIRPPEDVDGLKAVVKSQRDLQHVGEWRHRTKDGRILDVEITSHTIQVNGAKAVVVVANDITTRKRAERELQDSQIRFRNTLDNLLEGCQIIDFDWRYAYINEAAARQGHRRRDELLGHTMMEMYPGIENTELFTVLRKCMEERVPHNMENRFDNPDGATGWFDLSIEPVPEGLFILSIDITERKLAEEKTREQLSRMMALREIDLAILSSFDLQTTLNVALSKVMALLNADAVDVMLLDTVSHTLRYAVGHGFRFRAIERSQLRLGEGHAGRAALEHHVVHVPNMQEADNFIRKDLLEGEDFVSYVGAPLIVKGHLRGALEIFQRSPLTPTQDWFNFLDVLAGQIAIAIDNSALYTDVQRSNAELMLAYETTLEGWSAALDLRDKETEGHTQRVTTMSLDLSKAMGMREWELVHVRRGALLHDIGKMGVPDTILLKPDKLTEEEWEQMRMHPVYAYDLLAHIAYLRDALDIPYCHHEKWDGTGYPRGLKGTQIPLSARIFAVVDVYDALRSDRPYRRGWPHETTVEYIRQQSGRHFDPQVVEAFLNMLGEAK